MSNIISIDTKVLNSQYKLKVIKFYILLEEILENMINNIIWVTINDDLDLCVNEISNFIAINRLFEDTNEFLLNISKEYREIKNRDYEPNSIYAEF